MARKSNLPDEVKLFIIERLACFESPTAVLGAVKNAFGHEIARQSIEAYDPTKVNGQRLSARLREHFYRVREKFRADLEDIPIAIKAVRLRRLDQMAREYQDSRNYLGAARLLEQEAKEVGGVYVGRNGRAVRDPRPGDPASLEPRHPRRRSSRRDCGPVRARAAGD